MDYNWSQREYEAYRAHEAARAGGDIGIILSNLGYYNQGVVDAAASVKNREKQKSNPKSIKSQNKSKKAK